MFISIMTISLLIAASVGMAQDEFKGVTLRFLSQGGTAYNPALQDFAKEFERMTRAKILYEFAPWETLMPKVITDVTSGVGRKDRRVTDVFLLRR